MMGSEPNNPFERPRIAVRDTESQSDDGLSIEKKNNNSNKFTEWTVIAVYQLH